MSKAKTEDNVKPANTGIGEEKAAATEPEPKVKRAEVLVAKDDFIAPKKGSTKRRGIRLNPGLEKK